MSIMNTLQKEKTIIVKGEQVSYSDTKLLHHITQSEFIIQTPDYVYRKLIS